MTGIMYFKRKNIQMWKMVIKLWEAEMDPYFELGRSQDKAIIFYIGICWVHGPSVVHLVLAFNLGVCNLVQK